MKKKTKPSSRTSIPASETVPHNFRDAFFCVVGGILYAASLPKPAISICAWFCLVPLLFAFRDRGPARASLMGLLFGMTAFIGVLYWTAFPISVYGNISVVLALIFMVLLSFYVALYMAAFAAFVSWTHLRFKLSPFVTVPVALTTLEYLRSFLFTGFPWGMLGHSQFPNLVLMQVLDITGVYGVTFVVATVNAAVFMIINRISGRTRSFPVIETAVSALLILSLFGYGTFALSREHRLMENNRPVTVALIQPNIRQDLKWDPTYQDETMTILEDMTRSTHRYSPQLVVWPETATPFFFQNNAVYRSRVEELMRTMNCFLFFGTPAFEDGSGMMKFYNRAYLLSPDGVIVGHYDKIHLVPFAEYIPLRQLLFFVDKLAYGVIGDFSRGTITDPIPTPYGSIGSLICYEAIFPESARIFARNGAAFLITITNDAWFGRTSAPYQHFSMASMRAIETRLFLVRVANTGITAIVDPTGAVELNTEIFKRTTESGTIAPCPRYTFYTRFGDVFVQCLTVLFFLPLVIHGYSIIRKKIRR